MRTGTADILGRYAGGERSFQREDLRGRSFAGKDLSGADFSHSNLKGVDFRGARLANTKFRSVYAGRREVAAIAVALASVSMASLAVLLSLSAAGIIGSLCATGAFGVLPPIVLVTYLAAFLLLSLRQGVVLACLVAMALCGLLAILGSAVWGVGDAGMAGMVGAAGVAGAIAVAAALAVAAHGRLTGAVVLAAAFLGALGGAGPGTLGWLSAVDGTAVRFWIHNLWRQLDVLAALEGWIIMVVLVAVSLHSHRRAWGGDPRDATLRRLVLAWARLGGTTFRAADLSDADLGAARLDNTDLRQTRLSRARLHGAHLASASLAESDLRGARIDRGTYKQSSWTPELLGEFARRGIDTVALDSFPAAAQRVYLRRREATIRFLALAPNQARLDLEARAIKESLADGHGLHLEEEWAVRASDLASHLARLPPPVIVHLSGYGYPTGVPAFEESATNDMSLDSLAEHFRRLGEGDRCVVLNYCNSYRLAARLAAFIDCSIGMDGEIGDEAAALFASIFYRRIGSGASVQTAFDAARSEVRRRHPEDPSTPRLFRRLGRDAATLSFTFSTKE